MSPGFKKCSVEGCNAKVMISTGHLNCEHHRPRLPRTGKAPTPSIDYKARQRHRRLSYGVPSSWL